MVRGQTHPNSGGVRALDGWRVKAGEEGAVTHRVTLSEDQRTSLATGQLRVQPPNLTERQTGLIHVIGPVNQAECTSLSLS